jgi:putative ABC transport system permease protein
VVLKALAPENLPRLDAVRIDAVVLGFAALAALLAAAVFGIVPALRASRPDLANALRSGRAPGMGGGKLLRHGVVMTEVALSFVLLVGCGLMVRSFVALQGTDPGYDPNGLLTFSVPAQAPTPEERAAFARTLRERLLALPGVQSVTAAAPLPLDGGIGNARWGTEEAVADPGQFRQANRHVVLPGYFATLRTQLRAGRVFDEQDNREDATGIVIDELLAAKAFGARPAVGQRLFVRVRSEEPEWLQALFVTDGFMGSGLAARWAVRTAGPPARLVAPVRRVVAELDPRLPVAELQPMQAFVDRAMAPTRFALVLIGVFAAIAALLASVGLYGVLSTGVRQRTAEIGVRMALGAPRANIFRLVLGEGLRLSAIGVAAGVAVAVLLTRVMRSMLVGVGATDPATFVAIAVLFFGITAAACWLPARRAAGLDPKVAFREE